MDLDNSGGGMKTVADTDLTEEKADGAVSVTIGLIYIKDYRQEVNLRTKSYVIVGRDFVIRGLPHK